MNTPPPPPLHHFNNPYDSPYDFNTPLTPRSFEQSSTVYGSDWFSDVSRSPNPHIGARKSSSAQGGVFTNLPTTTGHSGITAAMVSTANKDYLYFEFTRNGAKWDNEPSIQEIPASQAEIKLKADAKNKKGTAILQLQRMGPNRRLQIDRFVKTLNNMEVDGSLWEVVYVKNTKERRKGNAMEVTVFNIILARSQPQMAKRNSTGPVPLPSVAAEASFFDFSGSTTKSEKRKSKVWSTETPGSPSGLGDGLFGQGNWPETGAFPSGRYGVDSPVFDEAPIFPQPQTRSRGVKPRIIDGLDPDREEFLAKQRESTNRKPSSKTADEILRNLPKIVTDDGVIDVDNQPRHRRQSSKVTQEEDRPSSVRSRSSERLRPASQRKGSDNRQRVRFSGQFGSGHLPSMSSGSSVTSADVGTPWDDIQEVEDMSSVTSEGTSSSSGHKKYSTTTSRTRRPYASPLQPEGSQNYELSGNGNTKASGRTRRQSSRVPEQAQSMKPYNVEQPPVLSRSNTMPTKRPAASKASTYQGVPPVAIYPHELDEQSDRQLEQEQERNVADYIRDSIQAQRERTIKDSQKKARPEGSRSTGSLSMLEQLQNLRLDQEFGQTRSTVYTHEPRNKFAKA